MNDRIHIALLNEGVDVWRPVAAEHVSGDLYRITEKTPDGEEWEFESGAVVRSRLRQLSGDHGRAETCLVAYEYAN